MKGLVFLLHPGPSLLVTAVFVAVSVLASGRWVGGVRFVQLVFVMLPVQFAIGITNDVCDLRADRAAKPWKPLVRRVVSRGVAIVVAVVLAAGALVVAGSIRPVLVLVVAGGLACGLAYNLGLARTVVSVAPWWGAFVLLPLASFLAAGRSVAWAGVLVGLAGLLALSLHLANALPDLQGDRVAGRMSLPVALGPRRSLVLSLGALAATAVVAMDLAAPLGQRVWVVVAGAAVALVAVLAGAFSGSRWLFPVLAPGGAVLAVCWLAALPGR